MAQPTVSPFPTPPSTDDPANFSLRADAFLGHFPTFVTEIDAYVAFLAASAQPVAITIPYTFSTTTTDSDPGAGRLRLGSATQNTATVIRADLADSSGATVTTILDALDDSTSTVKGYLRLTAVGDGTKWLLFSVSAVASATGYRNITVAPVASSAASPFADGDEIALTFARTGDKGDTGATAPAGAVALVQEQKATGVASDTPKVSGSENKRAYNTVVYDGIGISLSSGQVTLPAGTYLLVASAPCTGVNNNKVRLRNVTDNTTVAVGSTGAATDIGSSYFMPMRSWVWAHFTIASSKAFEVLHFISGSIASGSDKGDMGSPAAGGLIEVYADMFIWKLA